MWSKLIISGAVLVALTCAQGAPEEPFASPLQYHIQTDQGPERFFRYQTLTGQYRREQRHYDGSVTGTYGWVDPNGVLRLFDYISDDGGYRIEQQRLYKVGKAVNNVVRIPTLGDSDLEFGFEILPIDNGVNNVVDVSPKREAQPQAANVAPPVIGVGPFHHPVQISRLATPLIPILPPPPIVVVQEEPEPEPFVIGSAGTSLPAAPEPERKFVIGAAANGAEVKRPLPRSQSAVGAAAAPSDFTARRSQPASRSRSTTVIGAAANGSPAPAPARRPAAPSNNRGRGSGIVIGLRHNNRRKRLVQSFF